MKFSVVAILSIIVAFGWMVSAASGQGECAIVVEPPNSNVHGQWAGPFNLPIGATEPAPQEIAHAALLPPPTSNPDAVRVMFFVRHPEVFDPESPPPPGPPCESPCYPNDPAIDPPGYRRTWTWRPNRPVLAQLVMMPGDPYLGDSDPFCSGAAFRGDGSLVACGGQDYVGHCTLPCAADDTDGDGCPDNLLPFGHRKTWVLDPSQDPPVWSQGPDMDRERWYPTVIPTNDGLFVAGHGTQAEPNGPDGDPETCSPTYNEPTYETFQMYREATDTFDGSNVSIKLPVTMDCNQMDSHGVADYPRLHMLSNGKVMFTSAVRPAFMDIQNPDCVVAPEERWQVTQSNSHFGNRRGGSSVHFVYWQDSPTAEWVDVVYAIGGTDGMDDTSGDPGGDITDIVEKMAPPLAPDVGIPWTLTADTLNEARFNHNTVILLDGSLLVIGGVSGLPLFPAATTPELYYPPELFDFITEGGPNDVWQYLTLAVQGHQRMYHSVAVLMPDGKVASAGGAQPQHSGKSVEKYSPLYMFCFRPTIDQAPDPIVAPIDYDAEFEVIATLTDPTSTVERVALVRNGAATHAFDMNQRYVVPKVELEEQLTPTQWRIRLKIDDTDDRGRYAVPPGYYMLTVVERKSGVPNNQKLAPSEAAWVKVGL